MVERFYYEHFHCYQYNIYDGLLQDTEDNDLFIGTANGEDDAMKICNKLNELHEENERLLDSSIGQLEFAKMGGFSIEYDDRRNYYVYSENVIPKDTPIVIIKSPQTLWNAFIANYIWRLIEKLGEKDD